MRDKQQAVAVEDVRITEVTAPALLLVGRTTALISEKTRHHLYRLASLIMIATGLWFIYGAFWM
jgi:sulfite exporter TauE/SafE